MLTHGVLRGFPVSHALSPAHVPFWTPSGERPFRVQPSGGTFVHWAVRMGHWPRVCIRHWPALGLLTHFRAGRQRVGVGEDKLFRAPSVSSLILLPHADPKRGLDKKATV